MNMHDSGTLQIHACGAECLDISVRSSAVDSICILSFKTITGEGNAGRTKYGEMEVVWDANFDSSSSVET